MPSDMEAAIVFVEGLPPGIVSGVKDAWEEAGARAANILNRPDVPFVEHNPAIRRSTMQDLGLSGEKFRQEIRVMAAVETLERIGMERSGDLVKIYEEMEEEGLQVHRIREEYISTNVFSLAGLTTAPHLNEHRLRHQEGQRSCNSLRLSLQISQEPAGPIIPSIHAQGLGL